MRMSCKRAYRWPGEDASEKHSHEVFGRSSMTLQTANGASRQDGLGMETLPTGLQGRPAMGRNGAGPYERGLDPGFAARR